MQEEPFVNAPLAFSWRLHGDVCHGLLRVPSKGVSSMFSQASKISVWRKMDDNGLLYPFLCLLSTVSTSRRSRYCLLGCKCLLTD